MYCSYCVLGLVLAGDTGRCYKCSPQVSTIDEGNEDEEDDEDEEDEKKQSSPDEMTLDLH